MSKITYVDNDTNYKLHITHEEIDGVNELQWPKEGVIATLDDLGEGVVAKAGFINKPTFVSPSNGSIDFTGAITLSPYSSTINYKGSLTSILVEIATDANFTTIISTQTFSNASNSINLNISNSNTMLYVRVKHVSDIHKSDWSDTLTVTTKTFGINTPSVLFPAANSTDVSLTPVITTNAFSYFGEANTHTGTTYQIATDELFTDIIYNVSNTDLTSHLVATELPDLKTDLYIRVKHTGSIYGDSAWLIVIKFIILNVIEKMKIFNNTLESRIFDFAIDDDDNIIAVGYNRVYLGGNAQYYIFKMNRELKLLNSKTLSLSGYALDDVIQGIVIDNDGNYVVCGYTQYATTGPAGTLIKFDSNLNILSTKQLDGDGFDKFDSIVLSDDNKYVVCGYTSSTDSSGVQGGWVTMFGSNFETPTVSKRIGIRYSNFFNTILKTTDGYACAGVYGIPGFIYEVGIIFKFDNNLNVFKGISVGHASYPSYFFDFKLDSDGNYIVVGMTYDVNIAGSSKTMLVKLDSDLNIIYKKIIHDSNNVYNLDSRDMTIDKDDNIYLLGTSSLYGQNGTQKGTLIKLDKNLNIIYSKQFTKTNKHVWISKMKFSETNNTFYFTGGFGLTDNGSDFNNFIFLLENDTNIPDGALGNTGITISSYVYTISDLSYALNSLSTVAGSTSFTSNTISLIEATSPTNTITTVLL